MPQEMQLQQTIGHNTFNNNNNGNRHKINQHTEPKLTTFSFHQQTRPMAELITNTHTPNHIVTETDNIQENANLCSSDSTMDSTSDSK